MCCGILIKKKIEPDDDRFIKLRGQDFKGKASFKELDFNHYLLNVTGVPLLQPFCDSDDEILVEYNGEIYNHTYKQSDGENIIPLYKQYGIMFPQQLDGEFAIALYDYKSDLALFISDPFATKPLWRKGIECASYQSGLGKGSHKIPANTIEGVKISTKKTLFKIKDYHQFDFNNQYTDSYNSCLIALENAIYKRYKPNCFFGLSSGYDSGAIACCLKDYDFKAYTIIASEDKDIINQRKRILGDKMDIISDFDIASQERHLEHKAEEFFYDIDYDHDKMAGKGSYKEDYAAKALSYICQRAYNAGRKVYLSGMGADEILSDYSLIPNQSTFKGTFPKKLKVWKNFYDSCMYSYLGKEECVGGSWNIETRYPFLDKKFVQEFLNLTPKLKNQYYKAPLHEYLTINSFPFALGSKIGFSLC